MMRLLSVGTSYGTADWQYSSIYRYIKLGILNKQWGCVGMNFPEFADYDDD
jgi:hypothetical protein